MMSKALSGADKTYQGGDTGTGTRLKHDDDKAKQSIPAPPKVINSAAKVIPLKTTCHLPSTSCQLQIMELRLSNTVTEREADDPSPKYLTQTGTAEGYQARRLWPDLTQGRQRCDR